MFSRIEALCGRYLIDFIEDYHVK